MKRTILLISALVTLLAFVFVWYTVLKPSPQPAVETPPAEQEQAVPVSAAVMKGPTGVGAAYLMEQAAAGQNSYTFELADTPEQVVAMLTNGSIDIAALPTNLAANLYAKTGGEIQMAAITAYGMLYILEQGDTVQSWDDLRNQTIYATGRGANPEYILDYLLRAHGLTPEEDVLVEFKSEHAELATLMAAGEVTLGMLPEPFVTSAMMQNGGLRVAFDLGKEWDSGAEGQLAMTCVVVRREFAAAHPETVADFLAAMEQSIDYALGQVAETAELCEKQGIIAKAAVAQSAIPRCNLTFIKGTAMQETIAGYYEVLLEANPQAIGGALPDEDFYYVH